MPVIFSIGLVLTLLLSVGAEGANNKNGLKHPPKNIIIMVADGCGFNHIDAADIYQSGQIGAQLYEDFPVACGASTYMAGGSYEPDIAWTYFDYFEESVTDSAAAATAMSTGVKTYNGAIGVDSGGQPVRNIIERCEQLGKATGVVTSVQLSHATPAAFTAHNVSRDNYAQIAREMIYESTCEVIMGCGHPWYNNDGQLKSSPNTFKYVGEQSAWNDLVAGTAGGDADADGIDDPWLLIQSRSEFLALAQGPTPKRAFAVAQVYTTLQQGRSGNSYADPYVVPFIETVPTLEEMTRAALNILDNDQDGFFLMVEGGAVDSASHSNQTGRLIEELAAFNRAVEAVINWVGTNSNWGQTLLIVTADHETGYLMGPGSGQTAEGPVWNPLTNNGPNTLPTVEWHSGSHTNSLVPFYSKGRYARLFERAAINTDLVIGPYIDNTDIAKTIFALLDSRW